MVYRLFYRLLAAVGKDPELAPSCGHIHSTQGVEVFTLGVLPAVDYKVHLQKSGTALVPIGEGSDRDLLFEKSSGLRCALLPFRQGPVGTKEVVDGGRAHLHKEFSVSGLSLSTPFYLRADTISERSQPFRADAAAGFPYLKKGSLYNRGVDPWASPGGPSALTFFHFEEAGWRNFR